MLRPVEPLMTLELFPPLHAELLQLLRRLSAEDWQRPTAAAGWSVKDMVAHLLDTDLRRLSLQRDHLAPLSSATPIAGYQDLVDFLDRLNAEWVAAARRISPPLLIEWLAVVGPQVYDFFKTLDPFQISGPGVAWAGESQSPIWFDIAREYTEKWHHQQHIREAVGAPLLTNRRWLHPALDTFLRGLPHTYRDVEAPQGTSVAVAISGEAGGDWTLIRENSAWVLYWGMGAAIAALVRMDPDMAWRLFTKGISPAAARPHVEIKGDQQLGLRTLALLAIMA